MLFFSRFFCIVRYSAFRFVFYKYLFFLFDVWVCWFRDERFIFSSLISRLTFFLLLKLSVRWWQLLNICGDNVSEVVLKRLSPNSNLLPKCIGLLYMRGKILIRVRVVWFIRKQYSITLKTPFWILLIQSKFGLGLQ